MTEQSKGKIAVVGGGVIGLSWSATFAANGYDVSVFDPRDDLSEVIADTIPGFVQQVPGFDASGDSLDAVAARVTAAKSQDEAVEQAIAVQENGPEKAEFKQQAFADIEAVATEDCLLLSSSSGIPPEVSGKEMKSPDRLVIGHPFNPPHIVPLVEVVGSKDTTDEMIDRVVQFYQAAGKTPVRLQKAVPGFVANRLQWVLINEAAHLVEQGVVSLRDLDKIVESSLGIRWASVGPFLSANFGGGDGGLRHIFDTILSSLAKGMGDEPFSEELIELLGKYADEAYPKEQWEALEKVRDERQITIIVDHKNHPLPLVPLQGDIA